MSPDPAAGRASPASAPTPMRGWAPLPSGDLARDRVATYLPYEHEMLDRWIRWQPRRGATPIGSRVPDDLVAALRRQTASPALTAWAGGRPIFMAYPLPGRPVEAGLVVFEDPSWAPREGAAYRLERPQRRVAPPTHPDREKFAPEVLWVDSVSSVPSSEFYAVRPRPAAEVQEGLLALTETLGSSPGLTESLLLPLVGAPPWRGRPAGLDLSLASWEARPRDLAAAVRSLRGLVPPWPLRVPRPRRRRGSPDSDDEASDPVSPAPYRVHIEPLGTRGLSIVQGKAAGEDVSSLLYGNVEPEVLPAILFQTHIPILRPRNHFDGLAAARPDPEVIARGTDFLLRSHFTDPLGPEPGQVYTEMAALLPQLREALGQLMSAAELPAKDYGRALESFQPLRDHLVQAALARARLLGLSEAGPKEFRAVADTYLSSLGYLTHATRPSVLRELLRQASRARQKEVEAQDIFLRVQLLERPDISLAELWDRAKPRSLFTSPEALEAHLHRQEREGRVISSQPGRYRWVWL